MKSKNMNFLICFSLALVLIFTASAMAKSLAVKKSQPVIDAKTAATTRYLPVVFATHDAHAKAQKGNCMACHHDLTDNKAKPATCTSCHCQKDATLTLTDAMHKSCRGCHEKDKVLNKNSKAPTKCLGCHMERK